MILTTSEESRLLDQRAMTEYGGHRLRQRK